MKKTKYALQIIMILPLVLFYLACNPVENETNSASRLLILNISGVTMDGTSAAYLESDVLFVDQKTGATAIFADMATASLSVSLLDPISITGPSEYNDVTVDRYVVTYSRTDGKSTQGVDVPYSFEGKLSVLIEVDNTVEVPFVIVRTAAKAEPPLVDLHEGRDAGVLTCTAKVEFFGRDLANREVKATGYLTIYFSNFINGNVGEGSDEPSTLGSLKFN